MAHTTPLINIPFTVVADPTPVIVPGTDAGDVPSVEALLLGAHQRLVDDDNPAMIYLGLAGIGALPENPDWHIYRIDMAVGYVWQIAIGTWVDRATLEYV